MSAFLLLAFCMAAPWLPRFFLLFLFLLLLSLSPYPFLFMLPITTLCSSTSSRRVALLHCTIGRVPPP
ncbi:hypothetical protein K1719_035716 [Acacia pycnantha]|nr:hypothetical protein K1719_035716 [Acacia pycnantha]